MEQKKQPKKRSKPPVWKGWEPKDGEPKWLQFKFKKPKKIKRVRIEFPKESLIDIARLDYGVKRGTLKMVPYGPEKQSPRRTRKK